MPATIMPAPTSIRPHHEEKIAVDAIDLSIDAGESVGYVGPNGAGKSTTVKMLTGILVPSAGEVRVRGLIPHRQRIENARNIGVVFGQRTQLWWDLPVQESLRLLGDIYEVPADRFARSLAECVELLDLDPLLSKPARQLSLGQRMRCDLAAALLHTPSILYLDEPTIGLDIAVSARLRIAGRHCSACSRGWSRSPCCTISGALSTPIVRAWAASIGARCEHTSWSATPSAR